MYHKTFVSMNALNQLGYKENKNERIAKIHQIQVLIEKEFL